MRLSARNQISGKIKNIQKGAVNSQIEIEVAPEVIITSTITNEAVAELKLEVGSEAIAIIKSSSVMIGI
ncbi:molybdenum-pterin-binding protein [Acetobacteraceae bacterium]|nr:molybdenum-pterin-binding protein [Acetobacteraceae bacterium]